MDNYKVIRQYSKNRIRVFTIPNAELMVAQKRLCKSFDDKLLSEFATGFRPGQSVISNAEEHRYNKFFHMFDIKNFFASITKEMVDAVIDGIPATSFHKGTLPQGAPTSPYLSNIIMVDFDNVIGKFVESKGGVYTRYADDITISFKDSDVEGIQEKIIEALPKGLKLNEGKTRHYANPVSVKVVGVWVTDKGNLSTGTKFNEKLFYTLRHTITRYGTVFNHINPSKLLGELAWFKLVNTDSLVQSKVNKVMLDATGISYRGFYKILKNKIKYDATKNSDEITELKF